MTCYAEGCFELSPFCSFVRVTGDTISLVSHLTEFTCYSRKDIEHELICHLVCCFGCGRCEWCSVLNAVMGESIMLWEKNGDVLTQKKKWKIFAQSH